jgi:hypothetical protein
MANRLRCLFEKNPESAALVAATPNEMGRLLRPFFHMLAKEVPEVLRRPEP